ncbi:bile acid-CoA:amino acid N-acyltransferase-like isoform X2 [Patiria miniata]|nr:bile acid-CoA:amino acid N-acyltransferase-like isoform X2 [Patiria miniata]XP_038075507.1 bile acid-CoA:amino acid N-acyltransferase-like isoform X2 [Patiria miniata]XP_038075508.1 bile acid-CoA:amino acid N-acyltransferase-like isoform X2 [Patiria miniata]
MTTSQPHSGVAMSASLSVTPVSSLVDTIVTVQATGLESNSRVTIRSFLEHKIRNNVLKFEGHAHYIADDRGVVSVPDQMSLGGTYTGAEPMGLFWSMQPLAGQRLGVRFLLTDATKPVLVNLSLYRGHLDTETLQTAEPEATTTAERRYMGQNVERITVHSGRLRGTLFKPKGSGPFPGVIDMFGNVGGLVEFRSAMLASRGLACFALPYFGYDDLPTNAWALDLEYFKEAVDWLSDQPFVKPGGVGMVGVSLGAQFALATATYFPEKVRAVVSINGCHAITSYVFQVNGEESEAILMNTDGIKPSLTREGVNNISGVYGDIYDASEENGTVFKLENAPNCQFMFIAGEGDEVWDSCHYAREAIQRLVRHGCHNYQLLSYPNAGHLIEVPYAPIADVFFSLGIGVIEQGGTPAGNAKAMENSWPQIVRFLHAHCGHDRPKL